MRESALFLGAENRILGIATQPSAGNSDAPVALLLNAGLIHHVGPNRLNVSLARHLADRGIRSVRFDMSGIGDSARPAVDRPYIDQTLADLADVMDSLEQETGADRFVLIGLCTGAYNALAVAHADARVVGCSLIDGYAYPNLRYKTKNWLTKVTQLWRWRRYLRRRLGLGPRPSSKGSDDTLVFEPEWLGREEFARRILEITDRGVKVHFVYTGYGPQPYNYESQLFDAFPNLKRPEVSLAYLPHANHTFTVPGQRSELIGSLADWMTTRFSAPAPDDEGT